jgi:hypothetical protein
LRLQNFGLIMRARIYLGKVAKESGWFYGLLMLTAGGFIALIVFLIQLF